MSTRDGISEKLLLELRAQQLQGSSRCPAVLLIGVQACATVAAANALAGPDTVRLLHLDRAAGGVACGLGNAESMLGDDDSAATLAPGSFGVIGLNVEAARSYRLLREIVAQAAALVTESGCLLVAGPKKGGAVVAAATLREHFASVELEAYRKGHRIYGASRPRALASASVNLDGQPAAFALAEQPAPVVTLVLRGQTLQLVQDARIFARGQLNPASRMLAEVFEVEPGTDLLDLGCGGGVLGILAALLAPTARCTLVDADPLAVSAARRGAALSGAENVSVHLSDVLADLPGQTFDTILINPPFHRGRAYDPALAERFLTEASAALRPGGRLWVVCNRFLPYERTLTRLLGAPREAAGDRSYKVLVAARGE
jgi:16S rRNA (guanine1207-N2)-methyltransferase